jgi:3-keto-disaccharide hydrolase
LGRQLLGLRYTARMKRSLGIFALVLCLLHVSPAQTSPFAGRWDFNITQANGKKAAVWLGVQENGGNLVLWFQPTGGHVLHIQDYKVNGSHLTFNTGHDSVDLDAKDGKLLGTLKQGAGSVEMTGVPAPALHHSEPKAWTSPVKLFNGKDLSGWAPIGDVANSHWVVQGGDLVNEEHGANLMSDKKFGDFKLHFEVNCPEDANSGFYLRGRYEVQLEYEKAGTEPLERSMGAIYGRLAPSSLLTRKPGDWESFDVTLVGRTVTVVRNGSVVIDHKEIEGITGGALDANEGEPGPFYIQGDHTGGLKFRNIAVSLPKH